MSKTLLWLGAGDANTPTLRFQEYDTVILVDAHFNDFAIQCFNQVDNVILVKKGVNTLREAGQPFYILNNEEYCSFSKPTGLKQIFPNISVDDVSEVRTITPNELIKEFEIEGTENTLVIDLPCLFFSVLQDLESNGCLSLFDSVYVSAGKIPLYEHSESKGQASKLLSGAHFELNQELSEDPDLYLSHFCFNQNLAAIDRFKGELSIATEQSLSLSKINARIEAEKQQLVEQLQQADAVQQKQQAKASEIEAQLKVVQSETEKLAKQLSSAQKSVEQLQAENAQVTSEGARLVSTNKQLEAEKQQLVEQLQQADAVQQKQQAKASEIEAQLQAVQSETEKLAKQLSSEQKSVEQLQAENAQVTSQGVRLVSTNKQLEAEKQQLVEQLQQADAVQQKQQAKASEIEAQLQAVQSETEKLAKQLSSAQKSVEQLQAENAQVTSQGVRLVSTNKQLEAEKQQLVEQLQQADAVQQKQQAKASEIEAQLQAVQSEKEKLDKKLTNEHESVSKLQNEIKQLKTVKDKLAGQIEQGKSIAQDQQAAIESLENDNKQLLEEINKSRLKISDTENRLAQSEGKYHEAYDWFSSRKQQAETLAKEVETLKRENTALHTEQQTANAINRLESKLTSLIEKQGSDNVEIANALGQHVSKCTHEQRNTQASLFELQKLSALKHLPIAYSDYSMDASNLSQLSTLVTLNSYDVILEFGSGLSTVITASALSEMRNLPDNKAALSLDNPYHSITKHGEVTKALPSHIISFEQESKWLAQTSKLLAMAQLEDYVELCHAPLVNASCHIDGVDNPFFYDCTEKLLELKRIFSGRKVSILVVVDGPDNQTKDAKLRYAAFPLVLDYFSNSEITLFLDDANRDDETQVIRAWQREAERRSLQFNCDRLQTPKGIALITVKS